MRHAQNSPTSPAVNTRGAMSQAAVADARARPLSLTRRKEPRARRGSFGTRVAVVVASRSCVRWHRRGQAAPTARATISTIDISLLDDITGGVSLDLKGSGSPAGNIDAQFTMGERPDADKQLRCHAQVKGQGNWFQPSAETLRQQVVLCGRLR